ncbi:MAG: hypothetical protein PGN13_01085 [Patulibacter minatonensis]
MPGADPAVFATAGGIGVVVTDVRLAPSVRVGAGDALVVTLDLAAGPARAAALERHAGAFSAWERQGDRSVPPPPSPAEALLAALTVVAVDDGGTALAWRTRALGGSGTECTGVYEFDAPSPEVMTVTISGGPERRVLARRAPGSWTTSPAANR